MSHPMAKSSTSINPFRLLSDAWAFLWSQPALFHVFFWLLLVPAVLSDIMDVYWPVSDVPSIEQIGDIGYLLAQAIIVFLFFWGLASVLLVGRRMVINRAGRSRTSFRSVRRESVRLILPLFFTSLLRAIITIEWSFLAIIPAVLLLGASQTCRAMFSPLLAALNASMDAGNIVILQPVLRATLMRCGLGFLALPLLIPAAIYQIRSVFFGVVLASENLRYRDALRRSRDMVRGKTWKVLFVIIGLSILVFLPSAILSAFVVYLQMTAVPDLALVATIVEDVVYSIALLLFTLALVAFYGKIRKARGRVEEVVPELE